MDGTGERSGGRGVAEMREVEPSEVAAELEGGLVISHGGFFSGVEGAEPEPGAVLGEPDLGYPFAPVALAHATVEFGWFGWNHRRARVLHWLSSWAEEVHGVEAMIQLILLLLLLLLVLDLSLDLMDLERIKRGDEFKRGGRLWMRQKREGGAKVGILIRIRRRRR